MQVRDVYEMYSELVTEAIGDNKIDNFMDDLRRSTEVEIQMMVCDLLSKNVQTYARLFSSPSFEGFRKILLDIQQRYPVMDNLEKQDLFNKIDIVFKDIFVKNFSSLGPEVAELVATKYSAETIKFIKEGDKDPQKPYDDLYPRDEKLHPKAKDDIPDNPVTPITKPDLNNVY